MALHAYLDEYCPSWNSGAISGIFIYYAEL